MEDWLYWFLFGVALLAVEVLVAFTLYAGAVALGAFPAALAAALGASIEWQVAIFVVCALLSLLLIRPVARAHLITPQRIRTGTDALIGSLATVTHEVDDDSGQVKIRGGELWSARAATPSERYAVGDEVEVREIRGVTAFVGAGEK